MEATAEDIDKNLVEDFVLTEVVPGLIVDKALGSGSTYSMRGGFYGVGAAVVPSLITSVNGHAVGSSAPKRFRLPWSWKNRGLKGPPGTLSGRNAVQGLVNRFTARPTGELEGSIEVTMEIITLKEQIWCSTPKRKSFNETLLQYLIECFDRNINTGNDIDGVDYQLILAWITYDYQKTIIDDIGLILWIWSIVGCSPFTVKL